VKKRALLSVSDKTGIVEFAKSLKELGFKILSTGGTLKTLADDGIDVVSVSDITGFPECFDGRVKTLHPKIHGGILAMRENSEHMLRANELEIEMIDVVVVNLYPFKQTIMNDNVTLEDAIENIDIGGPSMVRSAAKNWHDVAVLVDVADYSKILSELKATGEISKETKLTLSCKAFEHTAAYDSLIASYLRKKVGGEHYPDLLSLTFEKEAEMRYGENPHQRAAFYKEPFAASNSLACAKQLHGKELSFNNINDANGALDVLKEFDVEIPTAVAVKHANPCGVGAGENIFEAYVNAYNSDPVSIFGGIVALNKFVDEKTAHELSKTFLEIIIAPAFSQEAFEILSRKKNIRLLELPGCAISNTSDMLDVKKVSGGLLVQQLDTELFSDSGFNIVTERHPTEDEIEQLKFAMKVVKHTKSNAIVLAKNGQTIGIGPGQSNRVTALNLAVNYAGDRSKGAVMASDAFFPFGDCVEVAHKAGVTAIIQPGGSVNDKDSIELCNKYNIAMVFTNMRHFKH